MPVISISYFCTEGVHGRRLSNMSQCRSVWSAPQFSPCLFASILEQGDHVEFDEGKVHAAHSFVRQVLLDQGPFDGLMAFSQV